MLEKYFSNIEKNHIKYFLSAKRMKNFENNYLVKKYFFNSSENLKKKKFYLKAATYLFIHKIAY